MAIPKFFLIATLLATLTVITTTRVPLNDTFRKINGSSSTSGANDNRNTLNAEGTRNFYHMNALNTT
jgi:hypothetical protein